MAGSGCADRAPITSEIAENAGDCRPLFMISWVITGHPDFLPAQELQQWVRTSGRCLAQVDHAHIEVPIAVEGDTVRSRPGNISFDRPARQEITFCTEDRNAAVTFIKFSDEDRAGCVDEEATRPTDVFMTEEVLAIRRKDLNAVVLAVGHEDAPLIVDAHAMGQVELAGTAPRGTP